MAFDEIVPIVRGAIRPGLDLLFLENVADSLAADLLDTQFAKFTEDPRQAEARRLGYLDY